MPIISLLNKCIHASLSLSLSVSLSIDAKSMVLLFFHSLSTLMHNFSFFVDLLWRNFTGHKSLTKLYRSPSSVLLLPLVEKLVEFFFSLSLSLYNHTKLIGQSFFFFISLHSHQSLQKRGETISLCSSFSTHHQLRLSIVVVTLSLVYVSAIFSRVLDDLVYISLMFWTIRFIFLLVFWRY